MFLGMVCVVGLGATTIMASLGGRVGLGRTYRMNGLYRAFCLYKYIYVYVGSDGELLCFSRSAWVCVGDIGGGRNVSTADGDDEARACEEEQGKTTCFMCGPVMSRHVPS